MRVKFYNKYSIKQVLNEKLFYAYIKETDNEQYSNSNKTAIKARQNILPPNTYHLFRTVMYDSAFWNFRNILLRIMLSEIIFYLTKCNS